MVRHARTPWVLFLVLAATLAACGRSTGGGGGGTAAPSAAMSMPAMHSSGPAVPDGGAAPSTAVVSIQNFMFAPATVSVKVGGTIQWTNMDTEPHTVTARDKSFASPALSTGQTYRHTFTRPGSYAYLCTIHPFMTAVVEVAP